jgi:hypothetical protein
MKAFDHSLTATGPCICIKTAIYMKSFIDTYGNVGGVLSTMENIDIPNEAWSKDFNNAILT